MKCKIEYDIKFFLDSSFVFNEKGRTCVKCSEKVLDEIRKIKISNYENDRENKRALLYLLIQDSGPNIIEYLPFNFISSYLFLQNQSCLYCGIQFEFKIDVSKRVVCGSDSFHSDHMDPLHFGGDDHPKNLAISCNTCNSKKGVLLFSDWLKKCDSRRQRLILDYYIKRHERYPEEFVKNEARTRNSINILYSEAEARIKGKYRVFFQDVTLFLPIEIKQKYNPRSIKDLVPKDFDDIQHLNKFLYDF